MFKSNMLLGRRHFLFASGLALSAAFAGCNGSATNPDGTAAKPEVEILNVSYDPTRELWKEMNQAFEPKFKEEHQQAVKVKQSHGGSGPQARAVIDGLDADVVTLALWSDTDAIRKKGIIAEGWEEKLPNRSLPYTSTIVFVVREGNPLNIKDWPDLVKDGVAVITPSPKTSGNGKLAFLGAWGSVVLNGGTEDDARKFVTKLYRNVPVLDTGARGATTSFAQRGLGNVHLTWENEAHLEVAEAGGKLQIVYPPSSILAEPHVAIVDSVVDRKKTREVAEEYLKFAYSPAGQEIIAKHFYRPSDPAVLEAHRADFPDIKLFPVTSLVANWDEAQGKFFGDGGVFDLIYQPANVTTKE
ncbi:sulfate ABC transporter substrate-binding protein [Planctomicrobium piriforme]|uniref:Sulfate transport system substrate-binding protein n=1 Tax=Planctomicrobium piriforme TaxID=1576369 RepID=A0A1I3F4Z2_9PLAN|nr:sulfate ABC transporter substrate-binding protein [Planctomicrobium piriforme]SFI06326.1 sulfate transport system substrate-binding protein [Planctomicrobium piriforme]